MLQMLINRIIVYIQYVIEITTVKYVITFDIWKRLICAGHRERTSKVSERMRE